VLPNGKYPASYEVLYGHGKKRSLVHSAQNSADDWQPVRFK